MRDNNEFDWGTLALISIIILSVIFIFKIIFVLSITAIFIGAIWFYFDRENNIPLLILIAGLILAPTSYYVGYQFEQTEIGKPIVNSAKIIVDTDNQLNEIPNTIIKEINEINIENNK